PCGRRSPLYAMRFMAAGCLVLGLLLVSWTLCAQTPNTANLRGQVTDTSGAALVRAEVTVANTATGLRRVVTTDESGYYAVVDLPLTGEYQLSVSKSGLAGKTLDKIRLRAGETATFNIIMAPEASRSEVTVFGTTDGIRSDMPQIGARLDWQKID